MGIKQKLWLGFDVLGLVCAVSLAWALVFLILLLDFVAGIIYLSAKTLGRCLLSAYSRLRKMTFTQSGPAR